MRLGCFITHHPTALFSEQTCSEKPLILPFNTTKEKAVLLSPRRYSSSTKTNGLAY